MNNKWFKYTLLILFLIFLGLYFSSNVGIIDYEAKQKNALTEEKIKEFEEDVKNNKEIDLKNYVYRDDDKYDNNLSKATLKLSNTIGEVVKGTLDFLFDKMEDAMDR